MLRRRATRNDTGGEGDCFVASLLAMTREARGDCFVAWLLAMTRGQGYAEGIASSLGSSQWHGRRRAIASSLGSSQWHGRRGGLLRRFAPRNDTQRLAGGSSPSRSWCHGEPALAGAAIPLRLTIPPCHCESGCTTPRYASHLGWRRCCSGFAPGMSANRLYKLGTQGPALAMLVDAVSIKVWWLPAALANEARPSLLAPLTLAART